MMATGAQFEVVELGIMRPGRLEPCDSLKAGQVGEYPCVAGKRQGEAETLGAGEVSISSSGAESGLLLRTDGRLELNGQVMVNGQSLNGLIRQIVLAILGGG